MDWCNTWNMKLNINKCKHMHISRNSSPASTYHINYVFLESALSYKYLGVNISSNLSWKTHINYIINNANCILGYIHRNFFHSSSSIELLLYKTLVRSKLEYSASVWSPGIESLISDLEAVQNPACRFILSNYHRTSSVTAMKLSLFLPPLSRCRSVASLCTFSQNLLQQLSETEIINKAIMHISLN
uniref:Putative endonuclease/reverse transcriptase n=1 Tax=Rhipicephalus microplus TaxID=6941 RepID=A0A6G5AAT4_RHIMP